MVEHNQLFRGLFEGSQFDGGWFTILPCFTICSDVDMPLKMPVILLG